MEYNAAPLALFELALGLRECEHDPHQKKQEIPTYDPRAVQYVLNEAAQRKYG